MAEQDKSGSSDGDSTESPGIRIPDDMLRGVSGEFGKRMARRFAELYALDLGALLPNF